MVKNEITNPKLKAQTFKARFLEPGVVKYDDEMVLIKPVNLMPISMDFKGSHVIINHQGVTEDEVSEKVVGYINNVWLGDDGWAWCDFTVNSEEAIALINQGYSVSCAYYPKYAEGGSYHNIPYDREIVGGEAIHLAIVKNPRYEDAIILKNSINKIMTIFKFKKDKKENKAEVREIELENALFEIEEGENVAVADMVEAYRNSKKNEEEEKKEEEAKVNADSEFEVDGEMVKVSELASAYKSSKKKNADDEEKKKEEESEAKKNEEEKEEKEKEDAKKNSVDSVSVDEAKKKFENGSESLANNKVMTDNSRFALGKSIYGSAQPITK